MKEILDYILFLFEDIMELKWYNWLFIILALVALIGAITQGTGFYDDSAVRPD